MDSHLDFNIKINTSNYYFKGFKVSKKTADKIYDIDTHTNAKAVKRPKLKKEEEPRTTIPLSESHSISIIFE